MPTTGARTWRLPCTAEAPHNWSAGPARRMPLPRAIRELMVDPLEAGWLKVYPQLDGIAREAGRYTVSMSLREAPQ